MFETSGFLFPRKRSQYIESGPDIKFQWISVRPSVAVRCLFKSLLDSLCQWRLEIVIGVWKDHGSTAKTVTQAHNQVGSYPFMRDTTVTYYLNHSHQNKSYILKWIHWLTKQEFHKLLDKTGLSKSFCLLQRTFIQMIIAPSVEPKFM